MSQLRLEMNTLQKQIYTDTATPICSVEPAIIKEHEVSKKLRHIICTKYLFKISTFCHSKTNKQTNKFYKRPKPLPLDISDRKVK